MMLAGEDHTGTGRFLKENFHVYLSLIALSLVVYGKCLFYGITNADDEVMITGNLPFLRNIGNILQVFTTDAFYLHREIDLYRPLQSLTYILDAQLGDNVVFFSHLTNLLLHILSCLAIYHLLLRLDFRRPYAWAGALVYSLHYLFMTAVVWLPARGDLLLALGTFLAFLTLIESLERPSWRAILLHLLCFAMALLAKESGIVLPLLFAVYLWSHDKAGQLTRRHILLPFWYVASGALYWMLKGVAVADSSSERGLAAFMKNLHQISEMVAKFYLPINMSTLPVYSPGATAGGLLIIAALTLIYLCRRSLRRRQALFYPAWFLLFMLPGLTYYPNFYSFANEHLDHRSYLICFGLLLANLYPLQQLDVANRRYSVFAGCLVLIYLAAFNLNLSSSYRSPEAFARKAIEMGSNSTLAYSNYGNEKLRQGEELEALRYLNRALSIVPQYMPALHSRARIFVSRGMSREALADLNTLLAVDPDYDADDYLLRGQIKAALNDYAGAQADFAEALRLNPEHSGESEGARAVQGVISSQGRNGEQK